MKISWKAFYLYNGNETIIVNFQRRITSKMYKQVIVLVVCTSSDDILYIYEISWEYPDRFLIYRADTQLLLSNF